MTRPDLPTEPLDLAEYLEMLREIAMVNHCYADLGCSDDGWSVWLDGGNKITRYSPTPEAAVLEALRVLREGE